MQPKKLSYNDSGELSFLSDNLSGMHAPEYETPETLEKDDHIDSNIDIIEQATDLDVTDISNEICPDVSSDGMTYSEICEAIDNADLSMLYNLKSDLESEGLIEVDNDVSSDGDQKVLTRQLVLPKFVYILLARTNKVESYITIKFLFYPNYHAQIGSFSETAKQRLCSYYKSFIYDIPSLQTQYTEIINPLKVEGVKGSDDLFEHVVTFTKTTTLEYQLFKADSC